VDGRSRCIRHVVRRIADRDFGLDSNQVARSEQGRRLPNSWQVSVIFNGRSRAR
jgi:hypothetical protein